MPREPDCPIQIAVVAENASTRFGGESYIPLQIYRELRRRKIQAILVVHERCAQDLKEQLDSEAFQAVYFVKDGLIQKAAAKLGKNLPRKLRGLVVGSIISGITAWQQKKLLRELIERGEVGLIHQPTPVSPRTPSSFFNLGAPVVIGPMNGNLSYPEPLNHRQSLADHLIMRYSHTLAKIANWIIPGKAHAHRLIVANQRTREALPHNIDPDKVMQLSENAVSEAFLEAVSATSTSSNKKRLRFIVVGHLHPYKATDIAIRAFEKVQQIVPSELLIVGTGPDAASLIALTSKLKISNCVEFKGYMNHNDLVHELRSSDVFVFTSLEDCGGAVILEAMAARLPVVATRWGGPIDYIDDSCGILVEPRSETEFVREFSNAMIKLASDPELRSKMGESGHQKVVQNYTWKAKVDQFIKIYHQVVRDNPEAGLPAPTLTLEAAPHQRNTSQADSH